MPAKNNLPIRIFLPVFILINLIIAFFPVPMQILLSKITTGNNALYLDVSAKNSQYTAIKFLKNNGVFTDDKNIFFYPQNIVSRAEFLKIALDSSIYKYDIPSAKDLTCFNDLPASGIYNKYICLAKKNNIINNQQNDFFRPSDPINCAEALAILGKIRSFDVYDVKKTNWFQPYFDYALNKGIITEKSVCSSPKNLVTRGEMTEILYRIFYLGFFDPLGQLGIKFTQNGDNKVYDQGKDQFISVDKKSFVLINTEYAKDKNLVYYQNKILKDADPASFQILNENYTKDKNSVFYMNVKVAGADPRTFQPLKHSSYGQDHQFVFLGPNIINQADPETFVLFPDSYYAKDQNHVFYSNNIIANADLKTFSVIPDSPQTFAEYALDNHAVYSYGEIVKDADPRSFQLVFTDGQRFTKDAHSVFLSNQKVPGADPVTFQCLPILCKDKNYVYDGIEKAEGIDAASLVYLKGDYLKDKNAVYFYHEYGGRLDKVEEADPQSFTILNSEFSMYGKDNHHVYLDGGLIEKADPETFLIIDKNQNLAKDKNHVYQVENIIPNADPATFQIYDSSETCAKIAQINTQDPYLRLCAHDKNYVFYQPADSPIITVTISEIE